MGEAVKDYPTPIKKENNEGFMQIYYKFGSVGTIIGVTTEIGGLCKGKIIKGKANTPRIDTEYIPFGYSGKDSKWRTLQLP